MSEYDYYIDFIEDNGYTQDEFSFEDYRRLMDEREEDRRVEQFEAWLHE